MFERMLSRREEKHTRSLVLTHRHSPAKSDWRCSPALSPAAASEQMCLLSSQCVTDREDKQREKRREREEETERGREVKGAGAGTALANLSR